MARVTGEVRNYLYVNEDLALLKETPIKEGVSFIFKIEMLNAFNRHVFGNPDGSPGDGANFGVVAYQSNSPRQGQLTLRVEF